ncbi:MAG: Arm DNA-binding domain-containing protein, partial [Acidiferrobacterales bacterium]
MGRQTNRLNTKLVETRRQPGYWCDGGGLYLQISATRSKSWIFRYTLNGKAREMGLGPLGTVSLAEARQKAADARKLLTDGIDPIEKRKAFKTQDALARAKAIGFKVAAEAYVAAHRPGWR